MNTRRGHRGDSLETCHRLRLCEVGAPAARRTDLLRAASRWHVLAVALAVLAAAGCGRQWTAPPQSVEQQLDQRIARARSLAIEAQRAEKDGRDEEAIRLYSQALSEYREYPAVWLNLGRLLDKRGDGMEAEKAYKLAAQQAPTNPEPLYNLGVLWFQRGYPDEAARQFALALERDENYKPALRQSIYIDQHILMKGNDITARRMRRALLIEDDPKWREFFEREKIRLDASLAGAPPGAGGRD